MGRVPGTYSVGAAAAGAGREPGPARSRLRRGSGLRRGSRLGSRSGGLASGSVRSGCATAGLRDTTCASANTRHETLATLIRSIAPLDVAR